MSNKTEEPTPRRLEQARAKGQVVHSVELNAALGLLTAAFLLQGPGKDLATAFSSILRNSLNALSHVEATASWFRDLILANISPLLIPMATIIFSIMLVGVATTLLQIGFKFANERKFADFSRVNPVNGLKRLFSLNGLQQLLKAILKLLIIGLIAYNYLQANANTILTLAEMDVRSAISVWVELGITLVMRAGMAYIVLAAADYIYLRWEFMRNMRMTKQEIKDELKQSEGDPFMRGRIRQLQRQMMARRMMAMVPKADVIVTNPTHLAIAIQYDSHSMKAPKVLAKGSLLVAQKIVKKAKENKIPIVQNIPLAHAIYKTVDLNGDIPPELYRAMAEILAYVYRLKKSFV